MSASASAIHRAAAIYGAVDPVSSINTDAWLTDADTASDADTGCTRTNAGKDAYTTRACARSPLPDAALRRAVRVAVNRGFSR